LVDAFAGDPDPSVLVVRSLNRSEYYRAMEVARFCPICGGFAPWTPRISELLHFECVPVFLKDAWLPPFATLLDWSKFSVSYSGWTLRTLRAGLKSFVSGLDYNTLREGVRRARSAMEYRLGSEYRGEGMLPLLVYEMARSLQTPVWAPVQRLSTFDVWAWACVRREDCVEVRAANERHVCQRRQCLRRF
jgi:hypothetical protein